MGALSPNPMPQGQRSIRSTTPVLEYSVTSPSELAAARRAVAEHLQRHGASNIESAILVASELVSNALLHGGGVGRVVVECDSTTIRITVHDDAPELPQPRRVPPPVGGRGLHIVQRLAQDWGAVPCPDGKDVWAQLPASAGAITTRS